MPLMVHASGGLVLQDPAGSSITTFIASPTNSLTPSELVSAAIEHDEPSASPMYAVSSTAGQMSTSTAALASQTTVPAADSVAQQETDLQASLNSSIPRNLLLAMTVLLLVLMIIGHPRFLARLFATRRPRSATSKTPVIGEKFTSNQPRRTGGGDLDRGWLLMRQSTQHVHLDDDDSSSWLSDKQDPFKDPNWIPKFPSDLRSSFIGTTTRKLSPTPTLLPPPHINPLIQSLPGSAYFLYAPFARLPWRFGTSLKIPQIAIVLVYLTLIGLAMIWKSDINPDAADSGHEKDFMRTGWVAMSQVPIVVALGVRSNIVGMCVGKGYERLKVFHKIVGRVIFLASTLHVAFYLWKLLFTDETLMLTTTAKRAGMTAWIAVLLIGVTAVPWLRQRFYTIFRISHVLGMLGLLIGLALHVNVARPWCIASAGVYCLSHVFSLIKTRVATAELCALSNDTTLVFIPSLCTGWRAGQHVRIRIPKLGPEAHPFTIASAPNGEGMILLCKAVGDWTKRLHSFAQASNTDLPVEQLSRQVKVILDGPYGGIGNTLLPSYSAVLLIAGGSGITHALALAHDLVLRVRSGVVRARTIDLVWVVRTEELASPLFPTLLDLVKDAKTFEEKCLSSKSNPAPVALRIKVYISRCPDSSPLPNLLLPIGKMPSNPFLNDAEKLALARSITCSRKSLSSIVAERGKPAWGVLVDGLANEVIERADRRKVDPSGVCVTACGPSGLVNDVRDAVRRMEGWKVRGVGGVDFEEEHFGF